MNDLTQLLNQPLESKQDKDFRTKAALFIEPDQLVGDSFSIKYDEVNVMVHDTLRQRAGGISIGCFLIATRVVKDQGTYSDEDSEFVLLRVLDSAAVPQSVEAERIRSEAAQRTSGDAAKHWDSLEYMDGYTHNFLSYSGLRCKVLGTFYFVPSEKNPEMLILQFGSDLSNFFPNQGLKVYKPRKEALEKVVNFADPNLITDPRLKKYHSVKVDLGRVRYASTDRPTRANPEEAKVWLHPANLLAQRTAVFGMSRTGKSNTVKIICKSVFDLRYDETIPLRVGQVIFDYNGEYANDNPQDESAIFNVWKEHKKGTKAEVIRYGLKSHDLDPERRILKINFFEESLLQNGKEIINNALAEQDAIYFKNFRAVSFDKKPDQTERSLMTRWKRRILCYRALLAKAGFEPPQSFAPQIGGLFGEDLLKAMAGCDNSDVKSSAAILGREQVSWHQLATALIGLSTFALADRGPVQTAYNEFDAAYIKKSSSGDSWADQDLKNILGMFKYANGAARMADARPNHTPTLSSDYADDIYNELSKGHLVIIDQSVGDDTLKQLTAEKVMRAIFMRNFEAFAENKIPPDIIVYAEESHNLLPAGNNFDLKNVWARTCKEGSKCNIGLIYITQEPSSIQRNIVKSTANFFIAHLNNEDEIREISKYYDFQDFATSIRKAPDRGFIRVKTLTNSYTVPVMVTKFAIKAKTEGA